MSKKRKTFLIFNEPDSKSPFLLRNEFHKALAKEGIIEEILVDDEGCIEVEEKSETAKLKKVEINELNYSDRKSKVERIWRVNLEKEIPGISTGSKTTEVALLVLQKFSERNYKLNVILIELKSSLQNSSLVEIKEKLRATTNRMYMLMSLNNHANPERGYDFATINLNLKAAIFYNKNNTQPDKIREEDEVEVYNILSKTTRSGLLFCSTLLNYDDKIEIKFFDKPNVALKDLL